MKLTILKFSVLSTLILLFATGCSKKQADEPKPEEPTPTTVTVENVSYNNYVKALFENKCNSCHASGGAGSGKWTFSGYTSVKSNASKIANVLLVTKVMPMNGSLSAKEIELLNAWFNVRNTPEN